MLLKLSWWTFYHFLLFFSAKVECSAENLFFFHAVLQSKKYLTPTHQFSAIFSAIQSLTEFFSPYSWHAPAEVKGWIWAVKQTDFGHFFSSWIKNPKLSGCEGPRWVTRNDASLQTRRDLSSYRKKLVH